jgi:hypothetical protein
MQVKQPNPDWAEPTMMFPHFSGHQVKSARILNEVIHDTQSKKEVVPRVQKEVITWEREHLLLTVQAGHFQITG